MKSNSSLYEIWSLRAKSPNSPRSPILNSLFRKSIKYVQWGDKTKLIGYITPSNKTLPYTKLKKRCFECNVTDNLSEGFRYFDFYPEPTYMSRDIILIVPWNTPLKSNIPYDFHVIYLGILNYKHVYLYEDSEITTLKVEESDFEVPILPLNKIINTFYEINPSLSKTQEHLAHSVLSNYIGSDFIDKIAYIDGMNSSYGGDKNSQVELNKIKNIFENKNNFIPISHFGIINFLNGNIRNIQHYASNSNSLHFLKTVSYNLPYQTENNISDDFRYFSEGLNIDKPMDLEKNLEFQHSILYYAMKNKTPTINVINDIMYRIMKEINKIVNKGEQEIIHNAPGSNNIDDWAGKMGSYYSAYSLDHDKIVSNVVKTFSSNVIDIVSTLSRETVRTELLEKEDKILIDPRIKVALYLCDKTEHDFIEKIMQITDWNYKIAKKYFDDLINKYGLLYSNDNIHFDWVNHRFHKTK